MLPAMLAIASICFVACSEDDHDLPAEATFSVALRTDDTYGKILVDEQGKTLYFAEKDVDGTSACSGGCVNVWPVVFDETFTAGPGLDAGLFGTITRADGQKQTTYKGWPLYRFTQDTKAGDNLGDNKNGFFTARPDYSLFFGNKGAGRYLVDALGRTLYTFADDTENASNCNGGCAAVWPAFFTEPPVVPSTLKSSDFYRISGSDSKQQVTFVKKPLYFFSKDEKRGDIKGTVANPKFSVITAN
ncbi:hypothetical protein L0663_01435 [Dyadobacter sp. CY107]|uniref:hypothetical protein n=1 Tax=Dyadobacter fanqingshengii TaxID=2906443 RepID=UPI001F158D46|nr:hypothetical protein [Dyadobacter fanqingshengii]MCF2502026.1 hypothetical protein [Dyadobacter fanqingshengii]